MKWIHTYFFEQFPINRGRGERTKSIQHTVEAHAYLALSFPVLPLMPFYIKAGLEWCLVY